LVAVDATHVRREPGKLAGQISHTPLDRFDIRHVW
jgi:hypothetical protein